MTRYTVGGINGLSLTGAAGVLLTATYTTLCLHPTIGSTFMSNAIDEGTTIGAAAANAACFAQCIRSGWCSHYRNGGRGRLILSFTTSVARPAL